MAQCPRCHAPKSECVHGYTRATAPKRRRKKKRPTKPTGPYWTCIAHGRGCGVKHRTYTAAVNHRRRLDLISFRAGRGRPWNVTKRA